MPSMARASESDGWDQDPLEGGGAGSVFVRRTPNVKQMGKAVRDDWDDDDDEEEQERDSLTKTDSTTLVPGPTTARGRQVAEGDGDGESSRIWEEANKRAPMPELIVAPASTSQNVPPLPPAALQPTLRILKRPSPGTSASHVGVVSPATSSSPSGSGATSPVRGTLAEREAQYQEARSRIFGEKEKPSASPGGVVVVRDPLGPLSGLEQDTARGPVRGFGERRRGKK